MRGEGTPWGALISLQESASESEEGTQNGQQPRPPEDDNGGQWITALASSGKFAFVIIPAGSTKRVQGHGALSTNMHFYSAIIFIPSSRGTSSKYIKLNQIKLIDFIETCSSCIQAHS